MVDIEYVKQVVIKAGKIFFDRAAAARTKEKGLADYVTEVDLSVQNYVYEELVKKYPSYQFMGEESTNENLDETGTYWVLDPVDGTTNLIHDYQNSAVSLALISNQIVIMGIVYNPFHDEMFWALKDQGCFLNDKRVYVSEAKHLEDSMISIGTSPYYKELADENFALYKDIFMDVQDIRRCGSAALDLAYVACGRIEAYLERKLKLWDYAAGALLVEEAGGAVLSFSGEKIDFILENNIVAGNPAISKKIVEKYLF